MSVVQQLEVSPASSAEMYQLGNVLNVVMRDHKDFGIEPQLAPYGIYDVAVEDPYECRFTPEERAEVRAVEQEASDFAMSRREAGYWERRPGTAYTIAGDQTGTKRSWEWGDPITAERFFKQTLRSPAIDAWRTKIPSAMALADLSDPFSRESITTKRGKEVPIDEIGRKWLTLCTDARAIRNRGTVMAESVKEFIERQRALTGDQALSGFRWMSIACGTALPAMKAAMHAGVAPEMLLVDIDKTAIKATRKIAEEIEYVGTLTQRDDVNIFDPTAMADLRAELGSNGDRPMLIDLMGIFEYTGDNLGVDPVKFLKSAYDMLHPGGRLIFGQMRDDRPVADFTMGAVCWPYVEMRSPREFMRIITEAGIGPDRTQLYLPDDGVYTVGVIDKPTETDATGI